MMKNVKLVYVPRIYHIKVLNANLTLKGLSVCLHTWLHHCGVVIISGARKHGSIIWFRENVCRQLQLTG